MKVENLSESHESEELVGVSRGWRTRWSLVRVENSSKSREDGELRGVSLGWKVQQSP